MPLQPKHRQQQVSSSLSYGEFGTDSGGSDKCDAADDDTFKKVKPGIY
ncbi:MAG: hypothetical protein ACFB16_03155 [Phormidesmis sp.]